MEKEYQDIDGIRFRRYLNARSPSDRTYFHCITKQGKKLYAHRYVWEKANGPIPQGWHVHHIDKDTSNNDPSNLEAMPAGEHFALHAAEPKNYEDLVRRMDYARLHASAWHKSEEGRAHHREIGFIAWENFDPKQLSCEQCDKIFMSRNINNRERFCSNACKSAWRRNSGLDDIIKICGYCHNEYTSNKYAKTKTFSRACSNSLRGMR